MTECPVSPMEVLREMIRGTFTKMTDADLQGFAGIEYDGYTGEINDCLVVLDHGPGGIVVNVNAEDGSVWSFDIDAGPVESIV